jgi:hypothetical protein
MKQEKRREVGFYLSGDGRVRQAVLCHRIDVMLNSPALLILLR